jgi:hypothetical protein
MARRGRCGWRTCAPTRCRTRSLQHLSSQAALDSNDPELRCGRDELRLTQLRSNPVPDEIARFQHELSCSRLQAQVQRLFESVAAGPPASAPPLKNAAPAEAMRRSRPVPGMDFRREAQAPPTASASSCVRDAERLVRLREDPTRSPGSRKNSAASIYGLRSSACARAWANSNHTTYWRGKTHPTSAAHPRNVVARIRKPLVCGTYGPTTITFANATPARAPRPGWRPSRSILQRCKSPPQPILPLRGGTAAHSRRRRSATPSAPRPGAWRIAFVNRLNALFNRV